MKKFLKIGLIVAIVGLLIGGGVIYYIFNKPHRNVAGEAPAFTLTADALYTEYSANEDASNTKYINKVIQVSGDITEISGEKDKTITFLDGGVSCALDSSVMVDMKEKLNSLKVGDKVTLKGKLDVYDELMGVLLTKCFIIEEEKK